MTLNETLKALGYTTTNLSDYRKAVRDAANEVTFVGTAADVWKWLRETGRIK